MVPDDFWSDARLTRIEVLMKSKKYLSFEPLRRTFSDHLLAIQDHRHEARCDHSLHDALMSGFACMYFQDPSLVQFQQRMQEHENRNNLRTLFAVETIPKGLKCVSQANFQANFVSPANFARPSSRPSLKDIA